MRWWLLGLTAAACECGADTNPLSDGSLTDAIVEDAAFPDAFEPDMGDLDTGVADVEAPCSLEVAPSDQLSFASSPSQGSITIRNTGGGLMEVRLSILGVDGTTTHPSVNDFAIAGCPALPCMPAIPAGGEVDVLIDYNSDDLSTIDLAELHVLSNCRSSSESIVVLEGHADPCLFPTAVITVLTPNPMLGAPILLDSSATNPNDPGATIVSYEWHWVFTPDVPPVFTNPTGAMTEFTADEPGTYIVGLHVTNSCGARTQVPGQEVLAL